jgi:hypothetical protein
MANIESEFDSLESDNKRVKREPEEEGGEEEVHIGIARCFNCHAFYEEDQGYTDDGFWVWTWRLGEMAWAQKTKSFCRADCHRTALQWTLQGLIPAATRRELKANVDALVRPLSLASEQAFIASEQAVRESERMRVALEKRLAASEQEIAWLDAKRATVEQEITCVDAKRKRIAFQLELEKRLAASDQEIAWIDAKRATVEQEITWVDAKRKRITLASIHEGRG